MIKAAHIFSRASGGAIALLMAFAILGSLSSPARGHGGGYKGANASSNSTSKGPRSKCEKSGEHCHTRHRRVREHWESKGRHRSRHGDRSRSWGNWGSAACGGGQGSCAAGSGRGYGGLASALGAAASDLTSRSAELGEIQKEIVKESTTELPGAGNPDAQKFDESTQSGESRYSDFTEASDPIVKEQIEQYNDIGKVRDELDEEAKKYSEQKKEMDALAEKSNNNATNLESSSPGVAGIEQSNGGPRGGNGNGNELANLGKTIHGNQENGSDISTGASQTFPDGSAKYPDKRTDADLRSASAGSTGAKGSSMRESLREKFRSSSGSSSSSRSYDETTGKENSTNAGSTAKAAGEPGSTTAAKETHRTVDSANADESLKAFGKELGAGNIALAGSETDASVKAMLNELGVEKDLARKPASQQNAEIGSKDGPSLFERCHETHRRCAKSGCVSQAGKERTGG